MRTHYSGYRLTKRGKVIAQLHSLGVLPSFSNVILEHVTFKFPDTKPAPRAKRIEVVGWASDERVQALLVSVDGQNLRPDGKPYHLTYSLDLGAKAVESNRMLSVKIKDGLVNKLTPFLIEVEAF